MGKFIICMSGIVVVLVVVWRFVMVIFVLKLGLIFVIFVFNFVIFWGRFVGGGGGGGRFFLIGWLGFLFLILVDLLWILWVILIWVVFDLFCFWNLIKIKYCINKNNLIVMMVVIGRFRIKCIMISCFLVLRLLYL